MAEFRKHSFGGGAKRPFNSRPGGARGAFGPKPFGAARGRDDSRTTEMYDAKCADCGKATQVPFRPSGDRPVFCKDCFIDKRDNPRVDPRNDFSPQRGAPRSFQRHTPPTAVAQGSYTQDKRIDTLKTHIEALDKKLDTAIAMLTAMGATKTPRVVKTEPSELTKIVKKVAKKKTSSKK